MDLYTIFFGTTTELFIFNCIGYVGSLLVIISMTMTSMIKLRFINSTGCVFSIIYSILTLSIPVLILNGALLFINVIQIIRHYITKRNYEVIHADVDGFTLRHFTHKYEGVIKKENPSFFDNFKKANFARVVFSDDEVVAMIVGKNIKNETLDIYLDFIDKNAKNMKLFNTIIDKLKHEGFKKIVFAHKCPQYNKYYEKLGAQNKDGVYVYA